MRLKLLKNISLGLLTVFLLAGCEPSTPFTIQSSPEASLPPLDTTQVLGQAEAPIISTGETFKVIKVVDGDTIKLENGQTVRYIGVDTPETVDPRKAVQCFGKEASSKNKELVEGKNVRLEKDVSETDKYGRLLRYVYIDNIFVNDYLARQGFAYAKSYPPDIKFQSLFVEAQREASDANRGLWSSCTPSSTSTSTYATPSKSTSIAGDKDCGDFATHDEAQKFFISAGGPGSDPHKLDVDKDGVACEGLP